jgi:REP element-mobilizing transposase RayT
MVIFMGDLPKRKHARLKEYDYSTPGAYFITICTQDRRCVLSHIVGRGLAPAEIQYTQYGEIAKKQLFLLEERYPNLKIDQYMIMPNHIHVIFLLEAAGASPRPTVMDAVCAYKSLTTRECKKLQPIDKLFQTSFYEHVIRGREEYMEIAEYITNNPKQWELDEMYSDI